MENNIGYIAISEFNSNTAADFKAAVDAMKAKKVTKFIFDVRNNPGGSLTAVVDVLDYILPKGVVCSTIDKAGQKDEFKSDDENQLKGDIVVLINGNTYSGGELFAAAIRDFKYGKLIGSTTYGKGMAQEIIPLDDGGALYLSTNSYYPPSGKNYEGEGVSPDEGYEVKLTPAQEYRFYELSAAEDAQLQAAIKALK